MTGIGVGCMVTRTTAFSIAHNLHTVIEFTTAREDPFGMHDESGVLSRVTIPAPGWYSLAAHLQWAANSSGVRYAFLLLNGVHVLDTDCREASGTANFVATNNVATTSWLNAGDYIECQAFQDSGGGLNVIANSRASPELRVFLLS